MRIDKSGQHAPRAKIVLMNADLHFLRELRHAIQTKNPDDMTKSLKTREEELALMRRVDLVLSYTDVEKAVILSHNLDSTKVEKCPWITEIAESVPAFESRKDIAFLGGFNHQPNEQAVRWFVSEVMPLVRRELPGVKFRVYGSHMSEALTQLLGEQEDLIAEGWVESVRDVYDHCKVFLAPLQSGAGIKGKVIGALGFGVPTVMTPLAAEGIGIHEGVDGFIAEKPEEWAAAISRIYKSPKTWAAVSQGALELARRQFGFERAVAGMRHALETAEIFATEDNPGLVTRI